MRFLIAIILFSFTVSICAQNTKKVTKEESLPAENYGGKVGLKQFLMQEMNYPKEALKNKIEGTVELNFKVDYITGKTSELKVLQAVSPEIDAEAIRLQHLLLFEPAKYLGDKTVPFRSLKIKFSVSTYKRYCKKRGYDKVIYAADMDTSAVIFSTNKLDKKPRMVFADSLDNISTFLTKNLNYPEGTRSLSIKGKVKVSFVVEPTGRITNIKLINGLGGGATNETFRLLKLIKWTPGVINGVCCRVAQTFEVSYTLSDDSGMGVLPSRF